MRILLIGATSSLARCLQPLLEEFADVVTAGRSGGQVALDLAGEVNITPGFDVVVNTAAHLGGTSAAALRDAEQVNVVGLLKLCQACITGKVGHLVQVSSIFALLETSSPFHNAYAMSKRHGDEAAQLFAKTHQLPLTIIRPSQFYGVGDTYRRNQPFLYTLMDRAQANQDIDLYGTRDAQRNFIHVQDVAHILARVVRSGTQGVFSCAYPENVRYSQMAQTAIDAFESQSVVRFLRDKPDMQDNIFPHDDALYQILGHSPQISMARGMQMEAAHRRVAA